MFSLGSGCGSAFQRARLAARLRRRANDQPAGQQDLPRRQRAPCQSLEQATRGDPAEVVGRLGDRREPGPTSGAHSVSSKPTKPDIDARAASRAGRTPLPPAEWSLHCWPAPPTACAPARRFRSRRPRPSAGLVAVDALQGLAACRFAWARDLRAECRFAFDPRADAGDRFGHVEQFPPALSSRCETAWCTASALSSETKSACISAWLRSTSTAGLPWRATSPAAVGSAPRVFRMKPSTWYDASASMRLALATRRRCRG